MINIPKAKKLHNLNIVRGSLLDQDVDVIVNAANKQLICGGGIDRAINNHAASQLQVYLSFIYPDGIRTGGVAFTPGFNLKQPYIIHTAGPIWKGGNENEKDDLSLCYYNSCYVADSFGLKSIAFCSISTGIYGYPLKLAVPVAIQTIVDYFILNKSNLEVTIALYGEEEFQAYEEYYSEMY